MKKLLIAAPDTALTQRLVRLLEPDWEICVCADGDTAVQLVRAVRPDALILHLNLPGLDGLSVLAELFPHVPPVVLALTAFVSPYIEQATQSLGVGYLVKIPCRTERIIQRLQDMATAQKLQPRTLARHLHALGFHIGWNGYRYLLAAIPLFAENPNQHLHKELYPAVMPLCDAGSVQCIERSMRFAIRSAWESGNPFVWTQYFPNHCRKKSCPSIKAFLVCLTEKMNSAPDLDPYLSTVDTPLHFSEKRV